LWGEQFLRGCSEASVLGFVCACDFEVVFRPSFLDLERTIDNCAKCRVFFFHAHRFGQIVFTPTLRMPDWDDFGVRFALEDRLAG